MTARGWIALAAVVCATSSSLRAGDESEAEKLAKEEGADAEQELRQLHAEAASAFEEFGPKMESLASWCDVTGLALDRSRLAEALLCFDPDHAKARAWLGFKRNAETWKPGPARTPSNGSPRPEVLVELEKRRSAVAQPLRALLEPLAERCTPWKAAGLRVRLVRALVNLFPEDAHLRSAQGEVKLRDRWVLVESAQTPKTREHLSAAVAAARADARKVAYRTSSAPGWTTILAADRIEVFSTLPEAQTREVADSVQAARGLFERALSVSAPFWPGFRMNVFANDAENSRFVRGRRELDEDRRRRLVMSAAYWLDEKQCVVADVERPDRLDSAVRLAVGKLGGSIAPLTHAPPCLDEGVGMYVTFRILGTRLSVFSAGTGRYVDEGLERDAAKVDADWVGLARKLVDKGYALDVPVLLGLPINSMTKDDGLFAFALAAYFLEGRPKDFAALLQALNRRGVDIHQALAETCGVDAEALQVRFVRWLRETAGK